MLNRKGECCLEILVIVIVIVIFVLVVLSAKYDVPDIYEVKTENNTYVGEMIMTSNWVKIIGKDTVQIPREKVKSVKKISK